MVNRKWRKLEMVLVLIREIIVTVNESCTDRAV